MRNVLEYVLRDEKVKERYVEIGGPYSGEIINYDEVYQTWLAETQVQKQNRLNPRAYLGLSLFFCMAQRYLFHNNQEKIDGVLQPIASLMHLFQRNPIHGISSISVLQQALNVLLFPILQIQCHFERFAAVIYDFVIVSESP